MNRVLLVGGFDELVELCERCGRTLVGIVDGGLSGDCRGYPVLGGDEAAGAIRERYPDVPVVISPDRPQTRLRLARQYRDLGFSFETLVDPGATLSRTASLGPGVLVHLGANVSSNVRLGDFVRVNVHANVMHDAQVAEAATIAPNAVLLGNVEVGRECYIGAAAVLLPGIVVGDEAVVGAGAVVTKNVAAGTTVVGNPAREIR